MLTGWNTKQSIQGNHLIVPGASCDQSSFQSEVAGLYALALVVLLVCAHLNIMSWSVEIGCDGKEALYWCFSPIFVPMPAHVHYDLIVATRTLKDLCPIQWTYCHVK